MNNITNKSELISTYSKEMIYDLYIIKNMSFIELMKYLNISRRNLRTLLTLYDITKDPKLRAKNNTYIRPSEIVRMVASKSSETQKKAWANKSSEEKETWCKKQRFSHSSSETRNKLSEINKRYRENLKQNYPEIEKALNARRKETCKKTWSNPLVKIKKNETEKINRLVQKNKLCRSISEQKLYDTLLNIYPDLKYDIRVDDRYPYFVDFYIPSEDIFIELNAHPSHGRLPIEYLDVDEYNLYKNSWVDTFARRDVEKHNKSLESHLKYIRIYPQATLQENLIINNDTFNELVEICYRSQK